jgi:hypothetical protein
VERTALELGGDRAVLASGRGGKRHLAARRRAKRGEMRPWHTKTAGVISVDCARRAAGESGEGESASRWQRKTKPELGARRPCSSSFTFSVCGCATLLLGARRERLLAGILHLFERSRVFVFVSHSLPTQTRRGSGWLV